MSPSTIKLGQKCRDIVTGFEGIVTSRVEYLNGCVQFCLKPRIDKDGRLTEGEYFDQDRLEIVDHGITARRSDTGGEIADCPTESYGKGC